MAAAWFFLLFFLSIIILSLASVNIDCGTSSSSVDKNRIKWVGDKNFITSGETATISSTADEESFTTLRYFPTGESNCYTNIPVTKGGKVLVRAMGLYGNYDGKSSSPSFSVEFEGKHQHTVSIVSATIPYVSELIFAPASGETNVCFVRTSSSSNPFVSSIEVVDLADGMYDELGPSEGLFYEQRRTYGTIESLRSDLYGRFWLASEIDLFLAGLPSMATSIDTSGASNKPPESILHNSVTGEGIFITQPSLPSAGVPVYLAMYFSEPLQSGLRSFNIFLDGKQVVRTPVVPVFGKATQVVIKDVVFSSTSKLVFQSTTSGIFPPIINALELYVISTGTSGGGSGSGSGGGSGGRGGSGSGNGGESGGGGSGSGSGGGSTNEEKKSYLPIIIGVVFAAAFVLMAFIFVAVVLPNRRKARLQALALPTSNAVANMGTGASPLYGQQMASDSNQPTNEAGIEH